MKGECRVRVNIMKYRNRWTIQDVEKAGWKIVTKDCGKDGFFEGLGCSTLASFLELD